MTKNPNKMPRHILMVATEADTHLLVPELPHSDYALTIERVDTIEAMHATLAAPGAPGAPGAPAAPPWDLVIVTFATWQDGKPARWEHETPLILVACTGETDRRVAAAALAAGADDYVMQNDLARLSFAVPRLLRRTAARRNPQQLEISFSQTLLDTIPIPIFYKDVDGLYLGCNAAFERFIGLKREEIVGVSVYDITAPALANIHHMMDQALVRKSGITQVYESKVKDATGTERDIILHKAVFTYPDGTLRGLIGAFFDITQRKQMEQALAKRTAVLQTLYRVSIDLSAEIEMPALLRCIVVCAGELLNIGGGVVFLYQSAGDVLHVVESVGPSEHAIDATLKPGKGIAEHVFKTGEPIIVDDFGRWKNYTEPTNMPFQSSGLAVPLLWQKAVTGSLVLFTGEQDKKFDLKDLWLAEMFAVQASAAIANARLYQELASHNERLEQAVELRTAELRRAKDNTDIILDNSPDAILLLRADGAIETFNKAGCEIFGYRLEDVYGQTPALLVSPDSASAFSKMLRAALDHGRAGRLEVSAWRSDGSTFDADAALSPIKTSGTVTGLVCSLRDISIYKEVQRMKDAFVTNVSHELRTPIASLKLYHELLTRNPQKHSVYMDRLVRETERLANIIEDLLYLSRLDQKQIPLKPSPIDLNEIARQYVIDRTPLAERRDLVLSFAGPPDPPLIQADAGLLGQALSVLLTNALNYNTPGCQIVVYTKVCEIDNKQWVKLAVSDTGPGILPEEQPQLFQRFFRGRAGVESGAPGTGLGLAIVKEIVDQHHGRVEVESTGIPGEGATFSIWLPA